MRTVSGDETGYIVRGDKKKSIIKTKTTKFACAPTNSISPNFLDSWSLLASFAGPAIDRAHVGHFRHADSYVNVLRCGHVCFRRDLVLDYYGIVESMLLLGGLF